MKKLVITILEFFKKHCKEGGKLEAFWQFWIDKAEIIVYLIVGVLTTVVSWGAKFAFNFIFYGGTPQPNATQRTVLWLVNSIVGVAFAYPTNRAWVFESKDPDIFHECLKFVASRISTIVLDLVVTQVLGALGMNV